MALRESPTFESVRNEFISALDKLPLKQKEVFSNCTSSAELLSQIRGLDVMTSLDTSYLVRFSKFTSKLTDYFAVLDVIVQCDPIHAATVWGALRLIIQLSSSYSTFFDKLTSMLDRFARVLPVYDELAELYRSDPSWTPSARITDALNQVYVDLIQFLRSVLDLLYKPGGKSRTRTKLFASVLWKPFNSRFAEITTRMNTHQEIIKLEIMLCTLTEVRASATRSRTRGSVSRGLGDHRNNMSKWSPLAIDQDETFEHANHADDVRLELIPPMWHSRGWFDETLILEGFSYDIVAHNANTLNEMMAHDDNIRTSITELTIHKRSQPFAQGSLRVAYYARTAASDNRFVVKSFKRAGKGLAYLAQDMRCQALCKAFALDFNAMLVGSMAEEHILDFIVTTCWRGKLGMGSGDQYLSLEPYIEGLYFKYNNNCGYVNEANTQLNQVAQAFSHFTFERSQGRFLVCDLQGVGNILTDPAIHTQDSERFMLADSNLGPEGFKFFFATHVCNSICSNLGLKSNQSMFVSGSYQFRESWLGKSSLVYCSNKLCGKIIYRASVNGWSLAKSPRHLWCDICYPQLHSSMTKLICMAPGPHHEFDASTFFYESQGQDTPRRCPDHHGKDEDYDAAWTSTISTKQVEQEVLHDQLSQDQDEPQIARLHNIEEPLRINESIPPADEGVEDEDRDIFESVVERHRYTSYKKGEVEEIEEGQIGEENVSFADAIKALDVLKIYMAQQEDSQRSFLHVTMAGASTGNGGSARRPLRLLVFCLLGVCAYWALRLLGFARTEHSEVYS